MTVFDHLLGTQTFYIGVLKLNSNWTLNWTGTLKLVHKMQCTKECADL